MVKSSQTIIWAQVDVLGSESHSIHCPTKTVVWDCDIGNDHTNVPAKHLDFWTWDVANLRTTTPIYLFGFYGHGGGLSREPCSTVFQGHQVCQVCNVFRVYIAPGGLPRIDIRVWLHVLGFSSQRITPMIQFFSSVISMFGPTWCHGPWTQLREPMWENVDERNSEFTLVNLVIRLSIVKRSALPFFSLFVLLLLLCSWYLGTFNSAQAKLHGTAENFFILPQRQNYYKCPWHASGSCF